MNRHQCPSLFLKQPLSFFLAELLWFEDHNKFLEHAREWVGHLVHVVLHCWSSRVFPDIESLIEGKSNRYRPGNSSLGNLGSVQEQSTGGAFPDASAVIRKIEAHHVIAGRKRLT